ncbi:EI24 domain-containing protein [Leptolyngbya iicbica]|uniref:Sulfate transporter CysZ n=2 Tax=Cyanophyceae TaxID=3028117 RepID=A0A4Q7EF66_9CYAN|nr:EI24 domain-containing protein [Leptolyngbya sp. LK]RZM81862.1 hypothetical protein DYY88_00880 [Leptolyngbya sp. LK]
MEKLETQNRLRPRGGGIPGILLGFTYPLRTLRLFLREKSLLPFVLIPLAINTVLGITLYTLGVRWGLRLVDTWVLQLTTWLEPAWLDTTVQILAPVVQGVLILLLFIVLGFVLLQFGTILGSPFYGQMSEKIELLRSGQLERPESLGAGAIFIDIWRAILFELKKLLLLAFIGLPLLLCNFIPGVGTLIATSGGIALACLLICLDMFDAPLERRRLKFRQKLGIVFRGLPASGSFAFACFFLVSIPFMNLLAIPVCVASGTLFFCDRILQPLPEEASSKASS